MKTIHIARDDSDGSYHLVVGEMAWPVRLIQYVIDRYNPHWTWDYLSGRRARMSKNMKQKLTQAEYDVVYWRSKLRWRRGEVRVLKRAMRRRARRERLDQPILDESTDDA